MYGRSAVDLGLVDIQAPDPPPPIREIAERELSLSRLDGGLVQLLRGQTQSIRMLDRRLGGAMIYPQTTAHVEQIERLVRYALPGAHREDHLDQIVTALRDRVGACIDAHT